MILISMEVLKKKKKNSSSCSCPGGCICHVGTWEALARVFLFPGGLSSSVRTSLNKQTKVAFHCADPT